MSEPIAIQAPQPSSTGSSRIGTAGFAIGIAIVALVVVAAVVGNALVYRDDNHVTTEYAQVLAPLLAELVERGLARN